MPDDIAYWKQERAKLQQQLNELEADTVQATALQPIAYLRGRIADVDRHIVALKKRRNA